MYITKEVEVWLDDLDVFDYFSEQLGDVIALAASVEQLHDEYHRGPVRTCSHPACHSAREGLRTAREMAERYRIEDPSMAALHAYTAKLREAEERAKGVYRLPAAGDRL